MFALFVNIESGKPALVFIVLMAMVFIYPALVCLVAIKKFGWNKAFKNRNLGSVVEREGCFVRTFISFTILLTLWTYSTAIEHIFWIVFVILLDLTYDLIFVFLAVTRFGSERAFTNEAIKNVHDSRKGILLRSIFSIAMLLGLICFIYFQFSGIRQQHEQIKEDLRHINDPNVQFENTE